MEIIHLVEGQDSTVTCNIVDHSLRVIDHAVGVAAFQSDVGYGGVSSSKALKKNFRDASRVFRFLGGIDMQSQSRYSPHHIYVGDNGVVWYEADRFQDMVYHGPSTAFRKITFSYGSRLKGAIAGTIDPCEKVDVPRLASQHLMSFRCRTLGPNESLTNYRSTPITIVSGVCMFSAAILEDIKTLGDNDMKAACYKLEKIAHHPALHAMEAMSRLSPAVADMICTLDHTFTTFASNGSASPYSIRVKLDVPRLAYYDVAREMLLARKWNFSSAARWLNIVDQRHDILFDQFSTTICDRLRERGLDPGMIKVYSSSGSHAAEEVFTNCIYNGQIPEASVCKIALKADTQNLWSTFLDLTQGPESHGQAETITIQDLARLAYTYEYFEPFLDTASSRASRVVITVDDPRERKILDSALKVLDKYEASHPGVKHVLIGVFVFFRILCAPSKDLFRFDCRRQFDLTFNNKNVSTRFPTSVRTTELADIARRLSWSSLIKQDCR